MSRELRVQGMYAFHHKHFVLAQTEFLAALFALARLEVVLGQFHLFAVEKGIELGVEQRDVEGVKALEVIVALVVERSLVAVEEVVVERDGHRAYAVGEQLYGQPFA